MNFLNLLLLTLERCPVPPLSELKVQPANCINTGLMSLFNLPLMASDRCALNHYLS